MASSRFESLTITVSETSCLPYYQLSETEHIKLVKEVAALQTALTKTSSSQKFFTVHFSPTFPTSINLADPFYSSFDFQVFFQSPYQFFLGGDMGGKKAHFSASLHHFIDAALYQINAQKKLLATIPALTVDRQILSVRELITLDNRLLTQSNLYWVIDLDEVIVTPTGDNDKTTYVMLEPEFSLIMRQLKARNPNAEFILLTHTHSSYIAEKLKNIEGECFQRDLFNHVLCCDNENKGSRLARHFIEQQVIDPRIIAIDDVTDNLDSIKQAFPKQTTCVQYMAGIRPRIEYYMTCSRVYSYERFMEHSNSELQKQYDQLLRFHANRKQ
ncbi:MAG: hypothetical protein ACPGUD_01395 [Parashewanella sp.]